MLFTQLDKDQKSPEVIRRRAFVAGALFGFSFAILLASLMSVGIFGQ